MSELRKRGVVKVQNGTYKKDGVEKNRYNEVGIFFATDHFNRIAIKLHNTASGEGAWLNVYLDEDNRKDGEESNFDKFTKKKEELKGRSQDVVLEDIEDKPIDLDGIPF